MIQWEHVQAHAAGPDFQVGAAHPDVPHPDRDFMGCEVSQRYVSHEQRSAELFQYQSTHNGALHPSLRASFRLSEFQANIKVVEG
jgi:hypothetical protein